MLQTGPFPSQFLGSLRLVPDGGIFEFAAYFVEAFALSIVVKDTPSERRRALACL
jgi:hypothetical protein